MIDKKELTKAEIEFIAPIVIQGLIAIAIWIGWGIYLLFKYFN